MDGVPSSDASEYGELKGGDEEGVEVDGDAVIGVGGCGAIRVGASGMFPWTLLRSL